MIAAMGHAFTIGVEEEFQIVDPDTWELRSHVSELLTSSGPALGDQIKRELHQSIVEVGTKICADVTELEREICHTRRELSQGAERVGLRIAAAGTHPFSRWKDQVISPGARYDNIVEELQQLARSLLIFGLHIHVAVPDQASTIELLNEARYFLPHLLALSTSSPFWQGRDTGLKSYRTTVFRRFPRSGIPDEFDSWGQYEAYLDMLVELHCITTARRSGGTCARTRCSARSSSASATCPRPPASRWRWQRWRRRSSSSCTACAAAISGSASTRARSSKRTSGGPPATASTAG